MRFVKVPHFALADNCAGRMDSYDAMSNCYSDSPSCFPSGILWSLSTATTILSRHNRMSNTPPTTRYSSMSLNGVVCLCAGHGDDAAWRSSFLESASPSA